MFNVFWNSPNPNSMALLSWLDDWIYFFWNSITEDFSWKNILVGIWMYHQIHLGNIISQGVTEQSFQKSQVLFPLFPPKKFTLSNQLLSGATQKIAFWIYFQTFTFSPFLDHYVFFPWHIYFIWEESWFKIDYVFICQKRHMQSHFISVMSFGIFWLKKKMIMWNF